MIFSVNSLPAIVPSQLLYLLTLDKEFRTLSIAVLLSDNTIIERIGMEEMK